MDLIVEDLDRFSIVNLLTGSDNIGIELGVAAGGFSARMMASGKFRRGFGVDSYSDHHDHVEYKKALATVGLSSDYSLLKMRFDEALDLFPDAFFDFIYVDGYAHSGEEGGKTFFDWLPKLKPGGIFAGDDYDDRWPLVKESVQYFAGQLGAPLHVTNPEKVLKGSDYNEAPSWFIHNDNLSADWQRNARMEARGAEIIDQTAQQHADQAELGRVFLALIQDSLKSGQPAMVDYGDKRIFVVGKDKK